MIETIVSGGQTGADQGGLAAAKALGLATGGWVPKGWRTDTGPNPSLAELGLKEHSSNQYPPRTKLNVQESDGTLVFGDAKSRGSALTVQTCRDKGKPVFVVPWHTGRAAPSPAITLVFRRWLEDKGIRILNVAGNRESSQPGIQEAVKAFLIAALS